MESINRLAEMPERTRVDKIALKAHVKVLQEEIKPLRGFKSNVGSDVRFPFYAKLAGYQLIGDSGAPCGHMLNYPIAPADYPGMFPDYTEEMTAELTKQMLELWSAEQKKIDAALAVMK